MFGFALVFTALARLSWHRLQSDNHADGKRTDGWVRLVLSGGLAVTALGLGVWNLIELARGA